MGPGVSGTEEAAPSLQGGRTLVCGRHHKASWAAGKQVIWSTARGEEVSGEHPLNHQVLEDRGEQDGAGSIWPRTLGGDCLLELNP